MKLSITALIGLYAIFAPNTLSASPCMQFPRSAYNDAQQLFVDLHHELRTDTDDKNVVALHDLILIGFNEREAEAICKKTPDARAVFLNKAVGRFALTAMHVAAMMGDIGALKWLVAGGASVDVPDKRHYLPAHFAALQEKRDTLNYLDTISSNLNARNIHNANAEQVWSLTHLVDPTKQRVFFDGDPKPVDGETFCVMTRTTFVERIKQQPATVLENWRKDTLMAETLDLFAITQHLEKFRSWPGDLYLKSIRSKEQQSLWVTSDYGLHAGKTFEPGDIVNVYGGVWGPGDKQVRHEVNGIEVTSYRGYLPFATHGFPNIIIVPFANRLGLRDGNLAVAIRPIAQGDAIMWNQYTLSDPGTPKEVGAAELDRFLALNPIDTLLASLRRGAIGLTARRDRAIIDYISHSARVFIRLLAEQKITVQDMRSLAAFTGLRIEVSGLAAPENIIEAMLLACERNFDRPFMREFFSRKAREDEIQILVGTLGALLMNDVESTSDLEELWQQLRLDYCARACNARAETCSSLNKELKSEL